MGRPKKRILLVDADEDALAGRRFFLDCRGFQVVVSSSADMALDTLRELREMQVDLLICRFELGTGMDGEDLVKLIKAEFPALRTLLFSEEVWLLAGVAGGCVSTGKIMQRGGTAGVREAVVRAEAWTEEAPAPTRVVVEQHQLTGLGTWVLRNWRTYGGQEGCVAATFGRRDGVMMTWYLAAGVVLFGVLLIGDPPPRPRLGGLVMCCVVVMVLWPVFVAAMVNKAFKE